jgi:hypothetical protein
MCGMRKLNGSYDLMYVVYLMYDLMSVNKVSGVKREAKISSRQIRLNAVDER